MLIRKVDYLLIRTWFHTAAERPWSNTPNATGYVLDKNTPVHTVVIRDDVKDKHNYQKVIRLLTGNEATGMAYERIAINNKTEQSHNVVVQGNGYAEHIGRGSHRNAGVRKNASYNYPVYNVGQKKGSVKITDLVTDDRYIPLK